MTPTRDDGPTAYDAAVFVNCPFDDDYRPLFEAIVFAVHDCGFRPRCALEAYDGGEVRIEKIATIIQGCRFGIHDISRTEVNAAGLPRFNMPFELGLFLGARRFGDGKQRLKNCLVLDRARFRYQAFLSDIAGQDIQEHRADPARAISCVRTWLASSGAAGPLPGGAEIMRRYAVFTSQLPDYLAVKRLTYAEMTFSDYSNLISVWLGTREGDASP